MTAGIDVLLVVDMQEGMLAGDPKHDLEGVTRRIDRLARGVRERGGRVCFVQHEGLAGEPFAPGEPGWRLLTSIRREPQDRVVAKRLNSAFVGTPLQAELERWRPDRLLVAGWATDMCVDATVHSAVEHGWRVVVLGDALAAGRVVPLDPAADPPAPDTHTPLHYAPTPGHPLRRFFRDETIEGFLGRLAAQQRQDGGWPIDWPAPGASAVHEWRAIRTLEALETLHAYGWL